MFRVIGTQPDSATTGLFKLTPNPWQDKADAEAEAKRLTDLEADMKTELAGLGVTYAPWVYTVILNETFQYLSSGQHDQVLN